MYDNFKSVMNPQDFVHGFVLHIEGCSLQLNDFLHCEGFSCVFVIVKIANGWPL